MLWAGGTLGFSCLAPRVARVGPEQRSREVDGYGQHQVVIRVKNTSSPSSQQQPAANGLRTQNRGWAITPHSQSVPPAPFSVKQAQCLYLFLHRSDCIIIIFRTALWAWQSALQWHECWVSNPHNTRVTPPSSPHTISFNDLISSSYFTIISTW